MVYIHKHAHTIPAPNQPTTIYLTRQVHEVELAHADVLLLAALLLRLLRLRPILRPRGGRRALHDDGEDGVGAGGGLVHERGARGAVAFPALQHALRLLGGLDDVGSEVFRVHAFVGGLLELQLVPG